MGGRSFEKESQLCPSCLGILARDGGAASPARIFLNEAAVSNGQSQSRCVRTQLNSEAVVVWCGFGGGLGCSRRGGGFGGNGRRGGSEVVVRQAVPGRFGGNSLWKVGSEAVIVVPGFGGNATLMFASSTWVIPKVRSYLYLPHPLIIVISDCSTLLT